MPKSLLDSEDENRKLTNTDVPISHKRYFKPVLNDSTIKCECLFISITKSYQNITNNKKNINTQGQRDNVSQPMTLSLSQHISGSIQSEFSR